MLSNLFIKKLWIFYLKGCPNDAATSKPKHWFYVFNKKNNPMLINLIVNHLIVNLCLMFMS